MARMATEDNWVGVTQKKMSIFENKMNGRKHFVLYWMKNKNINPKFPLSEQMKSKRKSSDKNNLTTAIWRWMKNFSYDRFSFFKQKESIHYTDFETFQQWHIEKSSTKQRQNYFPSNDWAIFSIDNIYSLETLAVNFISCIQWRFRQFSFKGKFAPSIFHQNETSRKISNGL